MEEEQRMRLQTFFSVSKTLSYASQDISLAFNNGSKWSVIKFLTNNTVNDNKEIIVLNITLR